MISRYTFVIGLLLIAASPVANASLMKFDFSGTIVAPFPDDGSPAGGEFSGYFILDPLVPDVRPEAGNAFYDHSVVDANVVVNGEWYSFAAGSGDNVYVLNDAEVFHDLFAILVDFENLAGTSMTLSLQFGDSSETVFDSDAFPTFFDLSLFDEFQVDNANGTGAFFIYGGGDVQGSIDFARLTAVPVPAALWLMAGGLGMFLGFARKRTAI